MPQPDDAATSDAGDQRHPRALSPKAVLTGLALVVLLALAIPWNDWSLQNTQLYNNYLPPVVTVCLLGIVLGLNPFLGRHRFRRGELVVVTVMLLGLGGVVSGGLIRTLPMTMVAPARHLAGGGSLVPLKEQLTPAQMASARARAAEAVALELSAYDIDGDGVIATGEFPDPAKAVRMDADGDGLLTVEEVMDYRATWEGSLVAETRWPLPRSMTVGIPEAGPIPQDDPEHRYVVDGYLDGLSAPPPGEAQRVRHRSRVTWRDVDGTVHQDQLALSGAARIEARREGIAFLDLDDPRRGAALNFKRVGETVTLPDGGTLEVLAVQPPGIPWYAWLPALATWSPLLLGAFIAMISLAWLVRQQWLHHERLPYPIAAVTLELMDDPQAGRRFPALFYRQGFWVAFVVVSAIITWRGLYAYELVPINITMELNLWWTVLRGEPWTLMPQGYWLARPTLWFSIIGMAFFMSLQVSFSLWFVFLASNFLFAWLVMSGVPLEKAHYGESIVGGFGAMVVVILWLGRKHYWAMLKAAVGLNRDPAARAAAPWLWSLLVGCGAMVGFLLWQGAPLGGSLLLVVLFLGLLLVLSRIVAESGMPFVQTGGDGRIDPILFTLFGYGLPVSVLMPLALVGVALGADNREALMPYAVNASAIGDRAGLRGKRLGGIMLIAAVLGTVVAFGSMLAGGYLGQGGTVDNWAVGVVKRHALEPVAQLAEAAESSEQFARLDQRHAERFGAYGVGAVIVALMGWARMMFAWFPLHPIGYLMMASWCTMITWASFFMGWLWKALVMRYGGTGLYRQLKAVAIGMIAGEAVTVFAFMIVRLIAFAFDVNLPEFKMLPR